MVIGDRARAGGEAVRRRRGWGLGNRGWGGRWTVLDELAQALSAKVGAVFLGVAFDTGAGFQGVALDDPDCQFFAVAAKPQHGRDSGLLLAKRFHQGTREVVLFLAGCAGAG